MSWSPGRPSQFPSELTVVSVRDQRPWPRLPSQEVPGESRASSPGRSVPTEALCRGGDLVLSSGSGGWCSALGPLCRRGTEACRGRARLRRLRVGPQPLSGQGALPEMAEEGDMLGHLAALRLLVVMMSLAWPSLGLLI